MSVDYRLERRAGFKQYYAGMAACKDIDPAFPLIAALFNQYELSQEQKLWVAFLYAIFYDNASVFYTMQEFPELEKVDIPRLRKWYAANQKRLQFQKDRKHNRHFNKDRDEFEVVSMVISYHELLKGRSQQEFIAALLDGDHEANYTRVTAELAKVYRVGRHTAMAWAETLGRCCCVPFKYPLSSFEMDDTQAGSSRNGLCMAIDREDLIVPKHRKVPAASLEILNAELTALRDEIKAEHPGLPVDYLLLETVCCAYKNLWKGRRYVGYYLDRMAGEIHKAETNMQAPGVNWETLWRIRQKIFPVDMLCEPTRYGTSTSVSKRFIEIGAI